MELDASDILGQPSMPAAHPARHGIFSLTPAQYIGLAAVVFGLYTVGIRLWKRVLAWRERSYKLATRRRHGIPDNDLRPFNVAYSEAAMKAREEENQLKPRPVRPQASVVDLREASQDHIVRNRSGIPQRPDAGMRSTAPPLPGGYNSASSNAYLASHLRNNEDSSFTQSTSYLEPHTNGQFTHAPVQGPKKVLTRHRGYLNIIEDAEGSDKKRSFDEDMVDDEHEAKAKKTRLQGDVQLMDEDEPPLRGAKRGARDQDVEEDEEDGPSTSKASRGKRARKVSQADSSMDVDAYDEEADEVADLRSFETARGKKRDRAEAGSTFGGDDDEEEAGSAAEFEDDKARRRRRKRRTVAKRKSEASYARGKKRDREGSGEASDHQLSGGESSPGRRSNLARLKKRGKRGSLAPGQAQALLRQRVEGEADAGSDVSMDGDSVSTSVRMRGRNVGDEWESNGVRYKIGPNFQRLRQALVKKARQKFVMPKDSQHPDRDANLQVCIETWLTEEEYQEAKAQHMLAWQDESPPPAPSEHPEKLTLDISSTQKDTVLFPQGANVPGKSLLWGSSTTTTPTLSPAPPSPPSAADVPTGAATPTHAPATRQGRNYRHSIATSAGLPISPFYSSQIPTAKRIASTSRALSLAASVSGSPAEAGAGVVPSSPGAGLSDSTNVGGAASPRTMKVFSKWEKQELEARAMMKIREANRKKEMEHEAKLKEERERNERAERERQERARQEREARERAEKERQERERQEKERKEKEAQQQKAAAAVTAPQITAPAPSTGPAISAVPSGAGLGFNFSIPASGATASVAAPSSPFGPPKTEAKPAAPTTTSAFSFGPSASSATSTAAQAKPFSFGDAPPLGGTEQPKKEEGAATAAASSGSLFARMGAQAPSAPAVNEPPKPAASSANAFSFGAPKQEGAPSTTSPFGAPTSGTSAFSSTSGTAPATSAAPMKFNFGVPAKNTTGAGATSTSTAATPAPSPFGAPTSSSLSGALGPEGNKAAAAATPSPFGGFKTPGAPASATNGSNASTSTTSAPIKFNFNGPSVFGGGSTASSESNKSAFGGASGSGTTSAFGGNAGTSGQSAFGGNTGSSGQSAFGGQTGQSVFGGNASSSTPSPFGATASQTQNAFSGGAAANKPAESKPMFNFATPNTTNAASTSTTTPATSNGTAPLKFSFGSPASSTAAAGSSTTAASAPASGAASTPFSFNFGSTPTAGATSTTPSSSPFGAPAGSSTQSAFGTSNAPSVFGGGAFGSTANQQK